MMPIQCWSLRLMTQESVGDSMHSTTMGHCTLGNHRGSVVVTDDARTDGIETLVEEGGKGNQLVKAFCTCC